MQSGLAENIVASLWLLYQTQRLDTCTFLIPDKDPLSAIAQCASPNLLPVPPVLLPNVCWACLRVQLKMLQGLLPSEELLRQYGLDHYLVFRQAILTGDVGLFERSMRELTIKMVADGTYLLWDLLIFHVYRR